MLIRFLSVATLLGLTGCSGDDAAPILEGGWAPPGACLFVGNRADYISCATTGTQLLANPQIYDGHRITLGAWAIVGRRNPDRPAVWIYLTQDSFEAGASQSAVLLEGPAVSEIVAFVETSNPTMTPRQLTVIGDFELFKPDATGNRRKNNAECCMFGRISNVEEWRP